MVNGINLMYEWNLSSRMEYGYWLTEYVYFMDEIYQNRMGKTVIWILVNRIYLFYKWNLSIQN